MTRRAATIAFLAMAPLCLGGPVDPIYQDGKGVAVKGTDVVAYFTIGQPTQGSPRFLHKWKGATWYFANEKHLEMFKADPEKYAPRYGGYCAYAVSKGKTASISPKAWRIVDGKLYLNHAWAKGSWEKDVPGNIAKAEKNWPEIEKKPLP